MQTTSTTTERTVSAANIVVPAMSIPPQVATAVDAHKQSKAEVTAIFRTLRNMRADFQYRVADRDALPHLIRVCIDSQFDTRPQIIGALQKIGYKPAKIATALINGTGSDPCAHWWERDAFGRYHNLR